ncbi:hypothetical protein Tco_0180027 [Tanacetum coccineum]
MTEEEETQASKKAKDQILQKEAGLAEANRLDELEKDLEKEEVAKQVNLDSLLAQRMAEEQELTEEQKKRKAQVQFEAQSYTEELKKLNFEEVKAEFEKLVNQLDTFVPMNFEATKESLKRFGEELQTKTAKKLKFDDESTQPTEEKVKEDKDDKPTKKNGKRRKQIARKGLHTNVDKDDSEDSNEASKKDDSTSGTKIPINPVHVSTKSPSIANYKIIKQGRKELYRIMMRKHGMNEPEDELRKVLWEYLKNIVHCLNLESVDIYMLIERKYPLSAEVCKAMLDKKLQGRKPDEDCYKLLKMMEKQAGIRKHKDWLVQEQMALGKDFSNPLIADNLPKIVWLLTHHIWQSKNSLIEEWKKRWLLMRQPMLPMLSRLKVKAKTAMMMILEMVEMEMMEMEMVEMKMELVEMEIQMRMIERELMKLMAKVYSTRNEIQKIEPELWNLTVKNNNLAAYTQRFQELTMMCTKMVPEEEDRLKGYAVKNAKNKRRLEVNQRDNHGQQPPFKRHNVGGQNVARSYTAGNNEKRGYAGPLPYCSKCKLHHEGPCTVKCGKCNKVRHMTRDCKNVGTLQELVSQVEESKLWKQSWEKDQYKVEGKAYCTGWRGDANLRRSEALSKVDSSEKGKEVKVDLYHDTKCRNISREVAQFFLTQITKKETEDKSEEKRLEVVLIVREFPEVFPKDLPGLPPLR